MFEDGVGPSEVLVLVDDEGVEFEVKVGFSGSDDAAGTRGFSLELGDMERSVG